MRGGGGTAKVATRARTASSPTLGDLWSDTLQGLCAGVAHSLKGSLNGVSVNLEVVRSRADKPDAPASSVSGFAKAASSQLDDVIAMSEAILSVTRAPRDPIDLEQLVRHMGTLLTAPARTEGRRLVMAPGFGTLGRTSANGYVVRLAVAGALVAAVGASADVECVPAMDADQPVIRIVSNDGAAIVVPSEIVDAAGDAGIRITAEPHAVAIVFPR